MQPMKHRNPIRSFRHPVILYPQKPTFRRQQRAFPFCVCRRREVFEDGFILEDGCDLTGLVVSVGFEAAEGGVDVGVEDYGEHE